MSVAEGLKFGTSGLRGLVTELAGLPAQAYTTAFCRHLAGVGQLSPGGSVLVGRDLRSSSPAIAADCIAAIGAAGFTAIDCGELPTPALAQASLERALPAIMVTGSHIPDDRNGLKFYRADGEITKADEEGILAAHAVLAPGFAALPRPAAGAPDTAPRDKYRGRFAAFFGPTALAGLTVGLYQHSSVARDILADILSAGGAKVVPLGRADRFIPVDTEALREEDVVLARDWAADGSLDAIVSTDGDADRPLVADEQGRFIRGDLVGLITALHLGADAIVTPVTSNSAIEKRSAGKVIRTRVGSPYVIAGMAEAQSAGATCILGFEANGGVLLGSTVTRDRRTLPALPTRDAALPILAVLAQAKAEGKPVSAVVAALGATATAGHRLREIPGDRSGPFLARLAGDPAYAAGFFAAIAPVATVSGTDGVRFTLATGEVVHYRASGNAPELRCYIEAATPQRAEELLEWGLKAAAAAVG